MVSLPVSTIDPSPVNVWSVTSDGNAGPRSTVASHDPTIPFAPCLPASPDDAEIAPATIIAATASTAIAPSIDFFANIVRPFRRASSEVASLWCALSVDRAG